MWFPNVVGGMAGVPAALGSLSGAGAPTGAAQATGLAALLGLGGAGKMNPNQNPWGGMAQFAGAFGAKDPTLTATSGVLGNGQGFGITGQSNRMPATFPFQQPPLSGKFGSDGQWYTDPSQAPQYQPQPGDYQYRWPDGSTTPYIPFNSPWRGTGGTNLPQNPLQQLLGNVPGMSYLT